MNVWSETVWAWMKGRWVRARMRSAGHRGIGFGADPIRPSHMVRLAGCGKACRSWCVQHRDPARGGGDKPTGAVRERGRAVWAWLKGRGWTKARMYYTSWGGFNSSVYTGRIRGNSSYLIDRGGVRRREPALAGRDKPRDAMGDLDLLEMAIESPATMGRGAHRRRTRRQA